MSNLSVLPGGWLKLPLGNVIEPSRVGVQPSQYPELRYVGMEHVESETMRLLGSVPATELKSTALHFWPGDVLYGRLRPYLNKVLRPDFEGLCSAEFIVFHESDDSGSIDMRYLQYFLNSWAFKQFASRLNEGDRPRVDWDQLKGYGFPLPPLAEQRRIVAAIEQQFTRLDAGVAALKRAQVALKRYRAAVLKAAVEGTLTAQWRAAHPDVEPAATLLDRILAERRAKWEADLRAKGKDPAKAKYEQPKAPDVAGLPALPDGWVWATVQYVADVIDPQPSHRTPPEVVGGVPYIGMGDITEDSRIDRQGARKVSAEVLVEHKLRYKLCCGDFIFGKIGTIGNPVRLGEPFDYALSANVVLVKPMVGFVDATSVLIWMASPAMESFLAQGSRATTQAAFGIQRMRTLHIPLSPLAEQEQIVAEVERRLSVVAELEATVAANLKRAERLRQSILERAFSGRLVPQDAHDEPASALLERIRQERDVPAKRLAHPKQESLFTQHST